MKNTDKGKKPYVVDIEDLTLHNRELPYNHLDRGKITTNCNDHRTK